MPDFTNMLSWWQWSLLAAVPPAIVALYFLKLKRRPVEVPSTFLWHKSIEDLHVNSIWQRLRRNILLLVQLLVILAAMLAVLRPGWHALRLTGHRFIFLVDNSASMQASDVKPSRLAEAKRRAVELVDQMRSGDVAMVISFCDTARVEQTFTDDRRRLREAIEAIRPTQRSTSLLEALKVASGLANPGRSAEDISDVRVATAMPAKLYIFSDGKFPPVTGFELGHLEPVFVPLGQATAVNVGIVSFSVGRNESKAEQLQAFARVQNFGAEPVSVPLKLSLDGRLIDADKLDIPAGEARGVAFDLGTAGTGVLSLKADTSDQLAADDEAWTVLNPPRRAKVLLVTPGNEPLQTALATKSVRELAEVQVQPPGFLKTKPYQDQAAEALLDLVIYDRCRPERMPRANTLFIGSLPVDCGWSAGAKANAPQIIDADASHPLLQWIDLGDVLLAEGTPLRVPAGGTVLVDSDSGPMLAIAPREGFEDAVLGFVIVDETAAADGKSQRFIGTNWPIRVSFSSFVLNAMMYFGGNHDTRQAGCVRPGTPVTLTLPPAAAAATVRTPSGKTLPAQVLPSGRFSFAETEELGVYEVLSAGKTVERFAVDLLDAAESDIRTSGSVPTIKIGYVEVQGQAALQTGRREIWRELLLLGLVAVLVEWYMYNRRVY